MTKKEFNKLPLLTEQDLIDKTKTDGSHTVIVYCLKQNGRIVKRQMASISENLFWLANFKPPYYRSFFQIKFEKLEDLKYYKEIRFEK